MSMGSHKKLVYTTWRLGKCTRTDGQAHADGQMDCWGNPNMSSLHGMKLQAPTWLLFMTAWVSVSDGGARDTQLCSQSQWWTAHIQLACLTLASVCACSCMVGISGWWPPQAWSSSGVHCKPLISECYAERASLQLILTELRMCRRCST